MEQLLLNLLKKQDLPVRSALASKEILKQDPKGKVCLKHSDMPLQYVCHIDKALICSKCLYHGNHTGHQVTELKTAKQMIDDKKKALEQRESDWDQEHMEFDSLLEKRKNEKLEFVAGLFGELEMIIKKRKLDLNSKISLGYGQERNRRESTLGEKRPVRQALKQKIEEYKGDFHTDIWTLLNKEVNLKPFELDTKLEDQNLLEFDRAAKTVNRHLNKSFKEQYLKLDSLSFPHDELISFKWPGEAEVDKKTSSLKISSHFRITAEDETLKIVLDSELNEDCVIELEKWKSLKTIEFRFMKLNFDQNDLFTLSFLFSRMNRIQKVKLIQEQRKGILKPMEEWKELEENRRLIIEFMTLLFQNLRAIELSFFSAECSVQVLRFLAKNVLKEIDIKILKKFSINFRSPYFLEDSSLWEILSICHETLESVTLDLSNVTVDQKLISQPLNLPNLKSFALMIDYGKNLNDKERTGKFIISSLHSMTKLEKLCIALYNCDIMTEEFVVQLFEQIEKIKKLDKLSFTTKKESYEHAVVPTRKDTIDICSIVSKFSKSLQKMNRLSRFNYGYSHNPKKLSSHQEIKSFIKECEKKWSQFQDSGNTNINSSLLRP